MTGNPAKFLMFRSVCATNAHEPGLAPAPGQIDALLRVKLCGFTIPDTESQVSGLSSGDRDDLKYCEKWLGD